MTNLQHGSLGPHDHEVLIAFDLDEVFSSGTLELKRDGGASHLSLTDVTELVKFAVVFWQRVRCKTKMGKE